MLKLLSSPMLFLGILSLVDCSGISSGDSSVSGTAAYQQRTVLPADAVLTIRIEDISTADDFPKAVGEQVMETKGAQVPIPFALTYDPERIEDHHSYRLRAYIKDGSGKFLFTNDTGVLVITNGNPVRHVKVNLIPLSE